MSSVSQWTSCSASQLGAAGTAGAQGLPAGATERDKKLKQYLEDERIALFLQNEEFMRELQRNREFLMALERGTAVLGVQKGAFRTAACLDGFRTPTAPVWTCLHPVGTMVV